MTTLENDIATHSAGVGDRVERVAAALRSHNIEAIVVDTGQEAREVVLGLIPDGSEVHSGKSKTLEDVGLFSELVDSGRFDAIRPRIFAMDRETQGREIRKLIAAPDFMLGSVAAVTDDGALVAASAIGSQLGPYAAGAGRVILIIGSQKIVPDLDAALRRIHDVVFRMRTPRSRRGWASTPPSTRSSSSTANGGLAEPRWCSSASRSGSERAEADGRQPGAVDRPDPPRAGVSGGRYPAPVAYSRFVVALGVTMSMSPTRTVSKVDDRRGRSRWTPGSSHSV